MDKRYQVYGVVDDNFGPVPISELHHPHRAIPNPVDGSLVIDPEIELQALGLGLQIEFFYNSMSTNDAEYGKKRSVNVNAYVANPGPGAAAKVGVWRGDEKGSLYNKTTTVGLISTYVPDSAYYATSTLIYDTVKFQERFPDGIVNEYQEVSGTHCLLSRIIAPSGVIQTFTYGTGAEAGLLRNIQVSDGRKVTFTYMASSPTSLLSSV